VSGFAEDISIPSPFWIGNTPGRLIYMYNGTQPGLCGFTPLMDTGNSPRPAIVPVCFPAFGSSYALMLVTGPVANSTKDGSCGAWLRVTRLFDTNAVYGWDCWYAVGDADTTNAPQQVQFGFDTQNWAGTSRYTPQWRQGIINPGTGLAYNQVLVVNDSGTYVNATDRISGGTPTIPYCYNQNKLNMGYMAGTWSASGGYQTASVWSQNIDLTGQGFGGGSNSLSTAFSGGFNWGATLTNRSGTHLAAAWLVLGQVRIWVY
jgi:hypothetical protein